MNNFFNTYFSKKQLERCGLFVALIGALSIFYGVLYQYNTLSYTELSFFSWTQSINDGVKILPVILIIFFSGFIGYEILYRIFRIFNKITLKWGWHILFSIILFILIVLGWKYIYDYKAKFSGNLAGTLYIGILTLLTVTSTVTILYPVGCLCEKFFTENGIYDISKWLNKNKSFIFFLIIVLTFLNSIGFIYTYPETINTYNCFVHQGKIYQLKYMNDKYIFTNMYTDEEKKDKAPFYTLVFENKDISFPLRFNSCSELTRLNSHYIKKDGKCIEVLSYDNNYQYFETNIGILKNNGYDLYLTGYCLNK